MYPLGSTTFPFYLHAYFMDSPLNEYYQVKFPLKLPNQLTIIHPLDYHNNKLFRMECSRFCKNSASFPVMCYLIDFIDIAHTVHNFIRRTKLISSFFKEEIELIISKITKFLFRSVIFHGIFWSGNSLILGYSLGTEQTKIFRL